MNIIQRIANYFATEDHDDDAWSIGSCNGGFRFKSPRTGISTRVYETKNQALRAMEEDRGYFKRLDDRMKRDRMEQERANEDFMELKP